MTAPSAGNTSSIPPVKNAARALGTRPRMSKFLSILLLVTALAHLPVAFAIAELSARLGAGSPRTLGATYAVMGMLLFIGRARAGMSDRKRAGRRVRYLDEVYFVHWCAAIFTLLCSIFITVGSPIYDHLRDQPLTFPSRAFLLSYAAGLVVSGYGVLVRRRWFVVRRLDVPIAGLHPSFDGYKIAHLSDLHIGTLTPRTWGHRWTRAANRFEPDLAVITGDMVTSGTDYHEDIADVVSSLKARDGVYVSMGNHDYFGEGEPLVGLLTKVGARVLRNEGVLIGRDDAKVYLAGIDDTWTRRDDLKRALRERPEGMTTILLAHDPERFREASKHDIALVLAGHTHGGQLAIPFMARRFSLSHLTHHYHLGFYQRRDCTLYVHPGLGTTGPPIRIGVAPAVVILTLRAT